MAPRNRCCLSICRSKWNYFNDCRWLRAFRFTVAADVQVGRAKDVSTEYYSICQATLQRMEGWMDGSLNGEWDKEKKTFWALLSSSVCHRIKIRTWDIWFLHIVCCLCCPVNHRSIIRVATCRWGHVWNTICWEGLLKFSSSFNIVGFDAQEIRVPIVLMEDTRHRMWNLWHRIREFSSCHCHGLVKIDFCFLSFILVYEHKAELKTIGFTEIKLIQFKLSALAGRVIINQLKIQQPER